MCIEKKRTNKNILGVGSGMGGGDGDTNKMKKKKLFLQPFTFMSRCECCFIF